jgi:hypothetical protein
MAPDMYYFLLKYRYIIWMTMLLTSIIAKCILPVGNGWHSFAEGILFGFVVVALPIWIDDCVKHRKLVWQHEDKNEN